METVINHLKNRIAKLELNLQKAKNKLLTFYGTAGLEQQKQMIVRLRDKHDIGVRYKDYTKQIRAVQKEIDYLNSPKEEQKCKKLIASLELEIAEFKEALEMLKKDCL
jgi:prefoldin subunit 5